MEPMTLGSPVGSPSSPPTSPFLPAFLMGEQAATPGSAAKSPPLTGKQLSFGTTPTLSAPRTADQLRAARPSASVLHHASEKGSGPPTRGLYDVDDSCLNLQSPMSVAPASALHFETPGFNTPVPSFSSASSPCCPTHPSGGGHWVTVFGFPASAAAHILSQFSQYGTVLASRSSPRGNWLHIKYQSSIEARKALSNNGKVFAGTFMVAVMPCKDPEVLTESHDKENQSMATAGSDGFFSPSVSYQRAAYRGADLNTPTRNTPFQHRVHFPTPHPRKVLQENRTPNHFRPLEVDEAVEPGCPIESFASRNRRMDSAMMAPLTPRQNNVRPLAQAYRAAQHPTEVVYSHTMPQRSTSLVGKAMEYIFGW